MSKPTTEHLKRKWWRLNHLYYIHDADGQVVQFKCNSVQRQFYRDLWHRNVILKARQEGFSTFIALWILDECLWHPGLEAGIVADTEGHAKDIFRRKIRFPYEQLADPVKATITLEDGTKGSVEQLKLANGSILSVSTSMRSGTCQLLHISEFGKIAAKHPEKAEEIVTGSLEAASSHDAFIFIESTAEGHSGYFFDYCKMARENNVAVDRGDMILSKLDWKFHFFPWFRKDTNRIDTQPVLIGKTDQEYFEKVEGLMGVTLDDSQKMWYIHRRRQLGDKMKREHPSYPDEAFEQTLEGAYFTAQFRAIRSQGRICSVPVVDGVCVDTWWDLGMDDTTVIWFSQNVGRELHFVDYHEENGEGLAHYKAVLDAKGYRYGKHYAPHDIMVRELGTGTSRFETAAKLGIPFTVVQRVGDKLDAIEAARNLLSICWFDSANCEVGVDHLESYRKEWDERRGCYKNNPLHDEHSNGADGFLTAAQGHVMSQAAAYPGNSGKREITVPDASGWT